MKKENIDKFEKLHFQIKNIYSELGILSKKSPDSAINKFKLKFVNQLLTQANTLLDEQYKPFADFDLFEEEDELIIIELVLTKQQLMTYTVVYQPEFYESYTLETIPSEHIVKYWTELEVGSYEQTKR